MNKLCSFDGCGRRMHVKKVGLCQTHYVQLKAGKELTPVKSLSKYGPDDICTFKDCTAKPFANWMCQRHSYYSRTHNGVKEVVTEVAVQEDERRCTICRSVKHWSKFARFQSNQGGFPKHECLDCYRKRILPSNEERTKLTTEDMLRMLGLGNSVDN